MKKLLIFSLLAAVFTFGFSTDINAQSRGKKKKKSSKTDDYFDDSGDWKQKLWYGGMVNFQIGNYDRSRNFLLLGISPMVGYKLTDRISAGPRATINLFNVYQEGPNIRVLETGLGVFARAKVTESIFVHLEHERLRVNELSDFGFADGSDQNTYGGVGYSSSLSGIFAYEIMALYNFQEDDEAIVPITIRAGVTYNF